MKFWGDSEWGVKCISKTMMFIKNSRIHNGALI